MIAEVFQLLGCARRKGPSINMSDQDRPHEPLDAAAILERSIFAIGRTLRRLLASTEPGPTSVTLAGFWELITIRDLKACRASDLALAMNPDASTISRQIKVLETSGFVSRQVDSDDARAIKLTLTPLGRQAIDGMIQLRRDRLAEALIKWDPSDTELLLSLLARLIGDLEN